jgi:hypothetical protein
MIKLSSTNILVYIIFLSQSCSGRDVNSSIKVLDTKASTNVAMDSTNLSFVDSVPLRFQDFAFKSQMVKTWPRKHKYQDVELELDGNNLYYRLYKSGDNPYRKENQYEYYTGVVVKTVWVEGVIKVSQLRYYDTRTLKLTNAIDLLAVAPFTSHKPLTFGSQNGEFLSEFDSAQASSERVHEYFLNITTKPDWNGNVMVIYQLEIVGDSGSTLETKYIFDLYNKNGVRQSRSKIISLKNEFASSDNIYYRPEQNILILAKGKGFMESLENDQTKICLYSLDKGVLVFEFSREITLALQEFANENTFLLSGYKDNREYVLDLQTRTVKGFSQSVRQNPINLKMIDYDTVEKY